MPSSIDDYINSKKENFIENDYVYIWIENEIVMEVFKDKGTLNLKGAKQIVADRKKVSNGVDMPIFVDARNFVSMNLSTINYLRSSDALVNLTHGGFWITNTLHRITSQIFAKLGKKPIIPTQFFETREETMDWIKTLRAINLQSLKRN